MRSSEASYLLCLSTNVPVNVNVVLTFLNFNPLSTLPLRLFLNLDFLPLPFSFLNFRLDIFISFSCLDFVVIIIIISILSLPLRFPVRSSLGTFIFRSSFLGRSALLGWRLGWRLGWGGS